MFTVLIYGLLLFIVGVGATIVYDKHKDFFADLKQKSEAKAEARKQKLAAREAAVNATRPRPSVKDIYEKAAGVSLADYLKQYNNNLYPPAKGTGRKVIKVPNVKVGFHKSDDVPKEQEFVSVDDLIKKIEAMKNKK